MIGHADIRELERVMAIDPELFTQWEHDFIKGLDWQAYLEGRLKKTKIPRIVEEIYKKAQRRR